MENFCVFLSNNKCTDAISMSVFPVSKLKLYTLSVVSNSFTLEVFCSNITFLAGILRNDVMSCDQ